MPRGLICDGCGKTGPLFGKAWLEVTSTSTTINVGSGRPTVIGTYHSLECLVKKAGAVLEELRDHPPVERYALGNAGAHPERVSHG